MTVRRTFTKSTRAKVMAKCDSHCGYCGRKITDATMHIDHMIARSVGGSNLIDNLLPACLPCNNLKGVWSLEEFRREIGLQVERCRRYSVNFRTAERFGMLQVIGALPVVFHFECIPREARPSMPMCGGYSVTA